MQFILYRITCQVVTCLLTASQLLLPSCLLASEVAVGACANLSNPRQQMRFGLTLCVWIFCCRECRFGVILWTTNSFGAAWL